ncbi:endonuclease/exonuclease/phosphatase family protein [Streptomyces sp. NPDC056367]|uniref:endonuclease/exonuclease/phosphatase family protein n=1 Tax=Streptomyces sp. NPDC056367 TaxID=3345797 RepID=UPI0035DBC210
MRFTAWTWNVSGHKMNRGSTDNGLVDEAVGSIERAGDDVDFASFNEMCHGQYQKVLEELADWNPANRSYARFQEAIPAGSRDSAGREICQGQAYGKALFSRYELGPAEYHVFAQESGHTYQSADGATHPVMSGLLCAPPVAHPNMKFCSVHITPVSTQDQPYGHRQLHELVALLDGFAKVGKTYMVAGDFNAQPGYGRLDQFYDRAVNALPGSRNRENRGRHRELDDTDDRCPGNGEWSADTTEGQEPPCGGGRKLDMIFVRSRQLASSGYTADTRDIPGCREVDARGRAVGGTDRPCTDHRVLIGHAELRIRLPGGSGR